MVYLKQLKLVLIHKWHVFLAGRMVGVPLWRLIIHDWSKFTPTELFGYAGNIYGSRDKGKWAKAWLHHLHCNPHHPEHWILSWRGNPEYYDGLGESVTEFVTVLPMPEIYAREMVVDWLATGKVVTGQWDMTKWLNESVPAMRLHSETLKILNSIIRKIGYSTIRE